MEIEDPNSEQITTKFSINVLQLLKSAQMQHGLRHGDYTRYRLYKSLKFKHGRGKYTRRAITESTVTEVRFLHVVLYMAERAWSHAMEKRQLPDGPNARQRIYLIGRLRKAVKWANLFSHLCAIKGDSRTSLVAEAYASYMKGSLLFEQDQNWDTALMHFKSAKAVYEELGKYGDVENQVLCRERVEELEPSIRYCLHKIDKSSLQTSELLQLGEMEEFHWLGHRFPISNAKTRVAILKAQELENYFHGYHEARGCIHSDLATAGNAKNVKDDLNGLDKAAVLGQRTIERNLLLVSIAKSKLIQHHDDKNEKVTKPEELVRLYDLLLQNTADLSDLVNSGSDRKPEEVTFSEECELKVLAFRAERCFYLARSYSLAGKRTEAYALYCHARSLTEKALQELQSHNDSDQMMIKELKRLYNECRSKICIEHATGILEEGKAPENLSKKMSTISLNGADTKGAAPRIEAFPPPFKSIPRSPIIMDLAHDFISFPSLDNRMKKDKKGFISRFWR
ncbi:hypothetical protein SLE2022_021380 [Rubroshorea leprosula]